MKITGIKTDIIRVGEHTLESFLDAYVPELQEGTVVAFAAKVVSVCEGRVVPFEGNDKDALIKQETSHYMPSNTNPYNVTLSVTHNLLVASGGIDESNADGNYILWPKDLQASANAIREHLVAKTGLQKLGVLLTDSTTRPLQWGTTGLGIAYSGFDPLKNYIGTQDIYGHTFKFQQSNIMNGLAAAAVVLMGEGDEQTPIALIEDVPFVDFVPRNPTDEELARLRISLDEDLYSLLLKNAPWQKGDQQA